jgi:hypothetical protein
MMLFKVSGADRVAPIVQKKTAATTGANPTVTLDAAMQTGNAYIAGFGCPRSPPTSTPPASWTETADAGYSTPTAGATGAFRVNGETGTSITFTSASVAYGMIGVEIKAAAAPAAGKSIAPTALILDLI